MSLCVGFIGFGHVAALFSRRLRDSGVEVAAFDRLSDDPLRRPALTERAGAAGVQLTTLPDLLNRATLLLSTVTPQTALDAAVACGPYLRKEQVYVDLNSTSPSVKLAVADAVLGSGASFVEGAILDAVGVSGAAARILLTGEKVDIAAEALGEAGLNVRRYPGRIGRASRFKMLRSVFSKGMEALLLELLLAGRKAEVEDDLWNEIVSLFDENPFQHTAANWVETHAGACERRYHELEQVIQTLDEIGVEPIMTQATLALFARSLALGLDRAFTGRPESIREVIAGLDERLTAQAVNEARPREGSRCKTD